MAVQEERLKKCCRKIRYARKKTEPPEESSSSYLLTH